MRIVRAASEAEVLASFLRGELSSPRYRERILALLDKDGKDAAVITSPDLDNEAENAYRAELLDGYRSWLGREGLFADFPLSVEWSLAALAPDEVLAIRYINWDWWLTISGGTREPTVAADRIRGNLILGASAEDEEPIAAALQGPERPPPLIAVSLPDRARLVVLEGHARLTAYALYPEYLPSELEIFLGTADDMDQWTEF